jgi:glycosyltransferase involved in cell wall biosynthesis
VPLEISEALAGQGHQVSKFSFEDAFPRDLPSGYFGRLGSHYRSAVLFPRRARIFVREARGAFDVIDANHADLCYTKADLAFDGLLVARSVGFIPAYQEFARRETQRRPQRHGIQEQLRSLHSKPAHGLQLRRVLPSLEAADLINVSNTDDLTRVRDAMGFGSKVVYFPFGLSRTRRAAFKAAQRSPGERLVTQTVAFVGAWNNRKGAADWPSIVSRVRAAVPRARFLFLGTGFSRDYVCRQFHGSPEQAIEVVPQFDSEELPMLLGATAVGAFPGYLEGFGFGVLEMLAAGLPVLAYDAAGPRDTLKGHAFPSLVPLGDVEALAGGIIRLLTGDGGEYARWSQASNAAADGFSWEEIAEATAALYAERLSALSTQSMPHRERRRFRIP